MKLDGDRFQLSEARAPGGEYRKEHQLTLIARGTVNNELYSAEARGIEKAFRGKKY